MDWSKLSFNTLVFTLQQLEENLGALDDDMLLKVQLKDMNDIQDVLLSRKETGEDLTFPLREINVGGTKQLYPSYKDWTVEHGTHPAIGDKSRRPFKNVSPVTTPVPPSPTPSSLDPTGAKGMSLDDFEAVLRAQMGLSIPGYNMITEKMQNQFLRVSIRAPGQQEALNLDLRPGPKTSFGNNSIPSVELVSPSGWNRLVGGEIYLPETGNAQLRNPIENFFEYIKASQQPAFEYLAGAKATPNQRFSTIIAGKGWEGKGIGVAGGLMSVGPVHPQPAREDFARRINIRFGEGTKDISEALRSILRVITDPQSSEDWRRLQNMVPGKGDTGGYSLIEAGKIGTDQQIWGLGKNAADMIKRLTVGLSRREETTFTQLGPDRRTLIPLEPEYINPASQNPQGIRNRGGYQWLNALIPGETERRAAIVQPRTFFTTGTPFSGANIIYQDVMGKAFSASYPSQEKSEFPQLTMNQLLNAKIQWGRFEADQDEQGKRVYREVFQKGGESYPLVGQYIQGGTSAIVGLVDYETAKGVKMQEPVRVSAEGRGMYIRDVPQWYLPSDYSPGTNTMMSGPYWGDIPKPEDLRPTTGILDQIKNIIGQGVINLTGKSQIQMYLPTGIDTGFATKGGSVKEEWMYPSRISTDIYEPRVKVGNTTAIIESLTGELKSPGQFAWQFAGWDRPTQHSAVGEFGGELGKRLQRYVRSVGTAEEGPVDPRALAEIWAGDKYEAGISEYQFYDALRAKLNALTPEQSFQKYGYTNITEPQWLPVTAVSRGERTMYTRQFFRSYLMANEGKQISPKAMRDAFRSVMKFEEKGNLGFSTFSVKMPGMLATKVAPATSEFRARMPEMGYREMAYLNLTNPQLAEELGLGLDQPPDATGLDPRHARAWREVGQVARYTADTGGLGPPPIHTEMTEEIRDRLAVAITSGETNLEVLDELLGGKGPLYFPETGTIFERPQTMSDITIKRFEDTELEENVGRFATQYPTALRDLIMGETDSRAMDAIRKERMHVFGTGGGGVNKLIAGRFSPNAISGRYSGTAGTGFNVGIMQPEAINQVLRQITQERHIKTNPAWWKKVAGQINQIGYLPGLFNRAPTLSPGGMIDMFFSTPEAIRRKTGIRLPEGSRFEAGRGIQGRAGVTGLVGAIGPRALDIMGDWDADLAQILLNLDVSEKGISLKPGTEYKGENMADLRQQIREMEHRMSQEVGTKAGQPGGMLNVIAKSFMDMFPQLAGGEPALPHPEANTLNVATSEDLFQKGLFRQLQRGGMGKSYNINRLMEAASSALGSSPEAIGTGSAGMVQGYQTYLDYIANMETGYSGLETFMGSGIFTSMGKNNEIGLMFKPSEDVKHQLFWAGSWGSGIGDEDAARRFSGLYGRTAARILESDLEKLEADTKNKPSMAGPAYLFASAAHPEDIPALQAAMEKQGLFEALYNRETGYYGASERRITESPVGLGGLAISLARTLGRLGNRPRTVEIEGGETLHVATRLAGEKLPILGEAMNFGQLKTFAPVRAAMDIYQWLTRTSQWTDPNMHRKFSPLPPTETAFLANYAQVLKEQTGNIPSVYRHIASQLNTAQDVEAVKLAGSVQSATFGAGGGNVGQFVPSTIRMRGSEMSAFIEGGPDIYGDYSDDIRRQTRNKWMLRETLGVNQEEMDRIFASTPTQQLRMDLGKEFEKEMIPKVVNALGLRDAIFGLNQKTQQGRVNMRRLFPNLNELVPGATGKDVTFGLTPDLLGFIGPEAEEQLFLGEFKWSPDEMTAVNRVAQGAFDPQVGSYYHALRAAAFVNEDPVAGSFGHLLNPWLKQLPQFQAMGNKSGELTDAQKQFIMRARAAARRGIQGGLFAGFGTPGNFQIYTPKGGPEFTGRRYSATELENLDQPFFEAFNKAANMLLPENFSGSFADAVDLYATSKGGNLTELINAYRTTREPKDFVGKPTISVREVPVEPAGTPKRAAGGGGRGGRKPPVPPGNVLEPEGGDEGDQGPAGGPWGTPSARDEGGPEVTRKWIIETAFSGPRRTPWAAAIRVRGALTSGFKMMPEAENYEKIIKAGLVGILGEKASEGLEAYQMVLPASLMDPRALRQLLQPMGGQTSKLSKTYLDMDAATKMLGQVLPADATPTERSFLAQITGEASPGYQPAQAGFRLATTLQQFTKDTEFTKGGFKTGITDPEEIKKFLKRVDESAEALKRHTEILMDTTDAYSDKQKKEAESALKIDVLKNKMQQLYGTREEALATLQAGPEGVTPEVWNKAISDYDTATMGLASTSAQLQVAEGERITGGGGRFWGSQASRLTRGLIGGWGLFYLQHLAQMPISAMSYGYEEAQQWGVQAAQYGGQYLGAGVSPFAADAYEIQRGKIQYGGGVMGAALRAGAGLPPIARDVGGAAIAGVAGGAGMLYLSSTAAMSGAAPLAALAGAAALPAGLITAGLMGMGIVNQWQENVPQTQLSILSQVQRGQAQTPLNLAGFINPATMQTPTVQRPTLDAALNILGATARLAVLSPEDYTQTIGLMAAQNIYQKGRLPTDLVDTEQMPTLLSALATSDQFKGLDPTAVYQAMTRMAGAGIASPSMARELALAQMRGIPTTELAMTAMQTFRQKPTAGAGINWETLFAGGVQNIFQLGEITTGMQAIQQVPLGYAQQALQAPNQYQMILQAAELARAPEFNLFQQQGNLYQQMYLSGREGLLQIQQATPGMTREQRYNFMQKLMMSQAGEQRAQTGMALGLPPELTDQLYQMGLNGALGQANADRVLQTYMTEAQAGYISPTPIAATDIQTAQLRQMAAGVRGRLTGVIGAQAATTAMTQLQPFMESGYQQAQFTQRMMQFEPIAWTRTAQLAGNDWLSQNMANVDIGLAGNITGLPWGTTSLQRGGISGVQIGKQIFGQNWDTEAGRAAIYGVQNPAGQTVAAMRGLQWQQVYKTREMQQNQLGIQAAQIALQEKYQPLFWNIEDRQRALSDQQAQWGFGQQYAQLGMQNRQFFEQMGLQQRGTMMQRAWTREDWGMNEQQRAMQWGWRQEDFQEQLRFATGRERKMAERGMERETIMYGLETDRVEKQQERQKRMWALEDERYEMNIQHHNEQRKFQEDAIAKQKEFYEAGKELRDEQVELQRKYWREQIELQKASLGIQSKYTNDMNDLQDKMMLLSDAQQDYNGLWRIATTEEVNAINAWIKGINYVTKQLQNMPGLIESGVGIPLYNPNSGGGTGDDDIVMMAEGGIGTPGKSWLVGEMGPELITDTSRPMSVYDSHETYSMLFSGKMRNPWMDETIDFQRGRDRESQPTTLIINIGNERLAQYVLKTVDQALEVS